jgi:RND superfamily putative drug exporter
VQDRLDLTLSSVVRPLLVVLVFGIVTDYSIFYLGSFREALSDPDARARRPVWSTWCAVTPIITAAAAVVLLGSLALYAARLELVNSLAPALGMAVVLSFVASTIFTPLLLASLGRAVFWPDDPRTQREAGGLRGWSERQLVKRWVAFPALLILGAGLVFAALQARDTRVATNLIDDLPASSETVQAERIASNALPDGAVAPTELVISGAGVANNDAGLGALEDRIGQSAGVAVVAGPSAAPGFLDSGILKAPSGNAARFLIVFEFDPYGSRAIEDYRALAGRMPAMLGEAGLDGVEANFAGDTAISSQVSGIAVEDLLQVGAIVIVLELFVLLLYLRSLLAPPLLLAITVLLVLAALGLTASVSEIVLGQEALSFLVPIATMVLLLSLGADYNLFLIGRVWSAQRSRPFTLALQTAATESSSTILTAGLALTASFAILAVVPLASFRQIALAMSIGLLADTLVIRPLLVPALLATLQRVATWPAPQQEDDEEPKGVRAEAPPRRQEKTDLVGH